MIDLSYLDHPDLNTPVDFDIMISVNENDINVQKRILSLGWDKKITSVRFIIGPNVVVSSTLADKPALDIGIVPIKSNIQIVLHETAKIVGAKPGGTAFHTICPITMFNYGTIEGGFDDVNPGLSIYGYSHINWISKGIIIGSTKG